MKKIAVCFFVVFFLVFPYYMGAQEKVDAAENNKTVKINQQSKNGSSAEQPILPTELEPVSTFKDLTDGEKDAKNNFSTYLENFHSKGIAYMLKSRNTESIRFLQIIVSNFGDEQDNTKLTNIINEFKEALKEYYKHRNVNSKKLFVRTKSQIQNLFVQMLKKYKQSTLSLLDRATDMLIDLEVASFHANTKKTAERRKKLEALSYSKERLNLAYNELSEAKKQEIDYRYINALLHYRISKALSIRSIGLLVSKEEQNKLKEEYQLDYLDLENFTLPKK